METQPQHDPVSKYSLLMIAVHKPSLPALQLQRLLFSNNHLNDIQQWERKTKKEGTRIDVIGPPLRIVALGSWH